MPVADLRSARHLERRPGRRGDRLRHAWGASARSGLGRARTVDTAIDDA